jgi:anaerobic selenocysteine-containing dehydrogenase
MKRRLSRREFLKASAAGTALLVTGLSVEACGEEAAEPAFFTPHERDTLSAAVSSIVPTDATPGAAEAGVVDYVEQLLTAFEHEPPRIFPGGPFSGLSSRTAMTPPAVLRATSPRTSSSASCRSRV